MLKQKLTSRKFCGSRGQRGFYYFRVKGLGLNVDSEPVLEAGSFGPGLYLW